MLHRMAQLAEQRQPSRRALVVPGVVDLEAGAGALRRVHRDVGAAHQRVRVLAVLRVGGDADARADVDQVAFDRERLGQHLDDLARHELRPVDPLGGQQHGELVAAEPRHGVAPPLQRVVQAEGDLAQQEVAHVVAERVVHVLEPVEVHGQHRELAGVRCAALTACPMRSLKSARFGRPVSGSL